MQGLFQRVAREEKSESKECWLDVDKTRDILVRMLIAVHSAKGRVNQPWAWTLSGPATRHFPSLFAISLSITTTKSIDFPDGWSECLRLRTISY
jgi:hypothetical protein